MKYGLLFSASVLCLSALMPTAQAEAGYRCGVERPVVRRVAVAPCNCCRSVRRHRAVAKPRPKVVVVYVHAPAPAPKAQTAPCGCAAPCVKGCVNGSSTGVHSASKPISDPTCQSTSTKPPAAGAIRVRNPDSGRCSWYIAN